MVVRIHDRQRRGNGGDRGSGGGDMVSVAVVVRAMIFAALLGCAVTLAWRVVVRSNHTLDPQIHDAAKTVQDNVAKELERLKREQDQSLP